ncbi:MAG: hypothetical protein ACYTGS_18725 [Planctomycetota bacterium]
MISRVGSGRKSPGNAGQRDRVMGHASGWRKDTKSRGGQYTTLSKRRKKRWQWFWNRGGMGQHRGLRLLKSQEIT